MPDGLVSPVMLQRQFFEDIVHHMAMPVVCQGYATVEVTSSNRAFSCIV